jgi:chromosome segregation ATPase
MAPVSAEKPKGDDGVVQTLRKAQGMLRQLSQDKIELEARNALLEKQLAEQSATIKALEGKAAKLEPLEGELKKISTARQALEQQLGGQNSRLHALAEQQKKVLAELQRYRKDNQLLVEAVKERTRWIEDCTVKNRSLVRANEEILEKLGDSSLLDKLVESEPFTGIAAVEKENAVQDFHYKIEDLQVTPWKEEPPTGMTGGGSVESPAQEEDDEEGE